MALPPVVSLDRKTIESMGETLADDMDLENKSEEIVDDAVNNFSLKGVKDSIFSVFDGFRDDENTSVDQNNTFIGNLFKKGQQDSSASLDVFNNIYDVLMDINSTIKSFISDLEFTKEKESNQQPTETFPEQEVFDEPKQPGWLGKFLDSMNLTFIPLAGITSFLGGLAPAILTGLKGIGIAGLVASAVYQGFKDFSMGSKIAESLGASDLTGGVAGAILGTDDSILGAFKTAGKWAGIGAAAGSVVPGVGTLAGGVVGAAFGGILGTLNHFIGFDTIVDSLQGVVDTANKYVEYFTGTDKERLEERLADLDRGRAENNQRIANATFELEDYRRQLQEARVRGDNDDIKELTKRIAAKESDIEKMQKRNAMMDQRRAGFEEELNNADEGFLAKAFEFSKKIPEYLLFLPLRELDSLISWLSGGSFTESYTTSNEDFRDKISKKFDLAKNFATEQITALYDSIVNIAKTAWDNLPSVEEITSALSDIPMKIWDSLKSGIFNFIDNIGNMIVDLFESIDVGNLINQFKVKMNEKLPEFLQFDVQSIPQTTDADTNAELNQSQIIQRDMVETAATERTGSNNGGGNTNANVNAVNNTMVRQNNFWNNGVGNVTNPDNSSRFVSPLFDYAMP